MYYSNDGQLKSVYCLTIITIVLSLISSGLLAYDDIRWNEIKQIPSNVSESDDQSDVLYNEKIGGLFVFTQYCGPGERVWKAFPGAGKIPSRDTYAGIDACCKRHDECPNYISSDSDFARYPGLPQRPLPFSRLECACDGQFFSCLNTLNVQYASTVAFGYGVVQSQCFALNYPIVGCNKYSNGLLPPRRCIEYRVDNTKGKVWQWFDVPSASSKLYDFPRTTTAK